MSVSLRLCRCLCLGCCVLCSFVGAIGQCCFDCVCVVITSARDDLFVCCVTRCCLRVACPCSPFLLVRATFRRLLFLFFFFCPLTARCCLRLASNCCPYLLVPAYSAVFVCVVTLLLLSPSVCCMCRAAGQPDQVPQVPAKLPARPAARHPKQEEPQRGPAHERQVCACVFVLFVCVGVSVSLNACV